MPFTYAVPLSAFRDLFSVTDVSLHPELTERLRTEIHADLERRLLGPQMGTPTGQALTAISSAVTGGDILFYSPLEYADAAEKVGRTFNQEPLPSLLQPPAESLTRSQWRYPGMGGNGVFAASVNAVLANAQPLARDFRRRSQEMGERRAS